MRIAPVADVKAKFSTYINLTQEGPVIVTRNGKPVAVLLQVQDDDDLERLILAHSPKFQQLLQDAEARILETGGVPHKDFWASVEAEPPLEGAS